MRAVARRAGVSAARTLPTDIGGPEGEALRGAALASFDRLVQAIHKANPELSTDEAASKAVLAWALAHGAVDVGQWGGALRTGFDAAALASDVGRAVGQLVLGIGKPGSPHRRRRAPCVQQPASTTASVQDWPALKVPVA